jgi:hypothetical protein
MGSLRDTVRGIAKEEAFAYLRRMRLLEEMNSSRIEASSSFFHRKEPWQISRFLGGSPKNPTMFVELLLEVLRRRGHMFHVFLEGCNGRDVRSFRGNVNHSYDFVCRIFGLGSLEFRLHMKMISDFESKTYLIARNIKLGFEDEVLEILDEVKEAAPTVTLSLGSRKLQHRWISSAFERSRPRSEYISL